MINSEEINRVKGLLSKSQDSIVELELAISTALENIKPHNRPDLEERLVQHLDICDSQAALIAALQDEITATGKLNFNNLQSTLAKFYGLTDLIRSDSKNILASLISNTPIKVDDDKAIN